MTESTYDLCFFYRSGPSDIIQMQTNDKFILADNAFASNEEKAIKVAKLITKDCRYLIPTQPIRFNRA